MATMMTTRRAMPPSMSAREREVLVVGRSYAPALLGWCSTMRSSLTWYPRSSSSTLGTSDCCTSHPGGWLAMLEQLLCQTLLLLLRNPPGICPRGRRGEVSKCVGSSRTRQAATPYLRMMGSRSHSESRRDRSKSDTRERRACGSPACVLGSGRPLAPLLCRDTITRHWQALCHARGRHAAPSLLG